MTINLHAITSPPPSKRYGTAESAISRMPKRFGPWPHPCCGSDQIMEIAC
jgi:hypothetical protein